MHFIFWLSLWIIAVIVAAVIATRIDRFRPVGCLPVLVLGPFGLLLMGIRPASHVSYERQPAPRGELKTCRHCARLIRIDARVCCYCRRELPQDR